MWFNHINSLGAIRFLKYYIYVTFYASIILQCVVSTARIYVISYDKTCLGDRKLEQENSFLRKRVL